MDRRCLLKGMGLAAVAPVLGACSAPLAPFNVGTIVFPGYEFLHLASEMGLYQDKGIRLVDMLSSTDNLRVLSGGRVQAATLTIDEVMTARADGLDLRVVLVFDMSAGADAVMARPAVRDLKDLAGRRIGVEDNAMGVVMLEALLAAAGLKVDQVIKVPMTVDRSLGTYQSGKVDALVTFEPWVSQLEALGARRLFDSTAVPERIVDVLAVRAEAIEPYAELIRQLVDGHFQARRRFLADPAASALMAARLQMPAVEVPQAFRGLVLPDAQENRRILRSGGRFDQSVQEIQRVFLANGLLRRAVLTTDLVDTRFLPAQGV